MEKEFVSYEQAVALMELGFNWGTYEYYDSNTKTICDIIKDVPAPLKQQVFRWFREKYNFDFYITRMLPNVTNRNVYHIVLNDLWAPNDSYKNYKGAESRLIDNLIELAKQQDK